MKTIFPQSFLHIWSIIHSFYRGSSENMIEPRWKVWEFRDIRKDHLIIKWSFIIDWFMEWNFLKPWQMVLKHDFLVSLGKFLQYKSFPGNSNQMESHRHIREVWDHFGPLFCPLTTMFHKRKMGNILVREEILELSGLF